MDARLNGDRQRRLESLLKPENKQQPTSLLTYHVVAGTYDGGRITGTKAKQFGIKSVQANIAADLRKGVKLSGANVTKTGILTSDGVIHVIYTVILPPKKRANVAARHH